MKQNLKTFFFSYSLSFIRQVMIIVEDNYYLSLKTQFMRKVNCCCRQPDVKSEDACSSLYNSQMPILVVG